MHILLGLLGSIVTILILLNRLANAGIDLGGLNPFLWHRRRKWRKRYETNPVYTLENPMEVTALLMVAVAKCSGDLSAEQKRLILELFQREFHLSGRNADGLLTSSSYLLKDGEEVRNNLQKVLDPSREKFTADQLESALSMIQRVASAEGPPGVLQSELHERIRAELAPGLQPKGTWA